MIFEYENNALRAGNTFYFGGAFEKLKKRGRGIFVK